MAKLGHETSHMAEEDFLQAYSAHVYPKPSVTTDLVIFTLQDCTLKVLLIKRKGHPYRIIGPSQGASSTYLQRASEGWRQPTVWT